MFLPFVFFSCSVTIYVSTCIAGMAGVSRGQKKVSDPLTLEIQALVGYDMDAGNT